MLREQWDAQCIRVKSIRDQLNGPENCHSPSAADLENRLLGFNKRTLGSEESYGTRALNTIPKGVDGAPS